MRTLSVLCFVYLVVLLNACKKDDPTPTTPTTPATSGCGDGKVCFNLDNNDLSKTGAGYVFADTFIFVKYEEGTVQLSIDIFGQKTGSYNVSSIRKKDNARIYYFPDANTMYMAETGSLSLTEFTSDYKATGTFSCTLYKYTSSSGTFDKSSSVVIKDGKFTKVQLVKSP
jgi:hypothetical protein